MRLKFFFLLATCCFSAVYAQDKKLANQYFQMTNFEEALDEYEALLEEEPENLEYHYRTAICYLNTNIDKSEAVSHLEFVVNQPDHDANALYLLGRAYHFAYEFDKAIATYQKFKSTEGGSQQNLEEVDRQIAHCQNAIELMKFPLDVTFENLGGQVNSEFPDYYPFIPSDESFIMFNSKRKSESTILEDGSYTTDVYVAIVRDGKYQLAKLAEKGVNTPEANEEIVGMSAAGDVALLYFDDLLGYGDLYKSSVQYGTFGEPEKLGKTINSKGSEIAACISPNGQEIYFASDREGGYGGVDLYVTRVLPNGKWGPAQNLGPSINTEYDEDFPNLSPDGKTLYFSSKGHSSMGGHDIFKAVWDENKQRFSGVRNMGYPINTPEDNMNFRISETGRYGYISALRKEGHGDLDIYRVTFHTIEPRYTVITGVVKKADGTPPELPIIYVTDLETGEEYGNYMPNANNMRYVIILPPGKFGIDVEAGGTAPYSTEVEIQDKSSYKAHLNMDFTLK